LGGALGRCIDDSTVIFNGQALAQLVYPARRWPMLFYGSRARYAAGFVVQDGLVSGRNRSLAIRASQGGAGDFRALGIDAPERWLGGTTCSAVRLLRVSRAYLPPELPCPWVTG